jgi:putative transposase
LIDAEKANYPITWMCLMLDVARSSFYAWCNRAETATALRRRELAEHVEAVFDASRGTYGCRRVTAALNRQGHPCSVGLVAELMRELGLHGCQPRAYKHTTPPGEHPVVSLDLIDRDFTADAPTLEWSSQARRAVLRFTASCSAIAPSSQLRAKFPAPRSPKPPEGHLPNPHMA